MKSHHSNAKWTEDLNALAAMAHGHAKLMRVAGIQMNLPGDKAREAKVADLKLKYKKGELSIDEKALAAKILDSLY